MRVEIKPNTWKLNDSFMVPIKDVMVLAIRLYLTCIFLISALMKIDDWAITLALFQGEYRVPLIPYQIAAIAITAIELLGSIALLLGFCTRSAALVLGIVNVLTIYLALEFIKFVNPAVIQAHLFWGVLLMFLCILGGRKWSLDAYFRQKNPT